MPSVVGDVVGSVVGGVAGDLLGGGKGDDAVAAVSPQGAARALGFTTRGSRATVNPSGADFRFTSGRTRLRQNLQKSLRAQSNQVNANIRKVRPGIGQITRARVNAIRDARRRTLGDLRETLARRRILGSSFAADTVSRADAEFGRIEADARARSFIEELDLTNQLQQQDFAIRSRIYELGIQELDLETEVATSLATNGASVLSGLAQAQARILAEQAASRGDLIAPALESIRTGISRRVSEGLQTVFNPSAGGSAGGGFTNPRALGIA